MWLQDKPLAVNRKQVIFAENSDNFAVLPVRMVHGQGAFIFAVFVTRDLSIC